MSDFDIEAVRARQAAARADAATELDIPDLTHLDEQAIDECEICDEYGYTPSNRICDHIDHARQTIAGRAAVRAELDKIRQRKTNTARGGAA